MKALLARSVLRVAVVCAGLLAWVSGCAPKPADEPRSEPALSGSECERKGGEVVLDPGDGSTRRNGCPGGRTLLGPVSMGIEGGICCAR